MTSGLYLTRLDVPVIKRKTASDNGFYPGLEAGSEELVIILSDCWLY